MKSEITIFHVISSTNIGGAELMLKKYLSHHDSAQASLVVSLLNIGNVGVNLKRNGINVLSLGISGPKDILSGMVRYHKIVQKYKPIYIIGWMYHANLFIAIHSLFHKKMNITWNIRCGLTDYGNWKVQRKIVLKLCQFFSGKINSIVYNSQKSKQQHIEYGFPEHKGTVVYNGFTSNDDMPSNCKRVRSDIGVPDDCFLIGSFGRNIPLKRMTDLLYICEKLRRLGCPAHILYIGRNFGDGNIYKIADTLGIDEAIHVLPEVRDIAPYYRVLDLFCLCSEAEGFPNVIGEAAYSRIPIVSTDISDLKENFLQKWQICPVGDIDKLAAAAHRIYRFNGKQRNDLIQSQLNAFLEKTQLQHVVDQMAKLFLNRM
jgi:glycosyltransferase involved in cell wall biosynthesis